MMKQTVDVEIPLITFTKVLLNEHLVIVSQNYLREQPDNIKSVNLIAETSSFLGLIYSSINPQTVSLVTELFNTLIEFSSVCILDNHISSIM